jgi:hypothetical protein
MHIAVVNFRLKNMTQEQYTAACDAASCSPAKSCIGERRHTACCLPVRRRVC